LREGKAIMDAGEKSNLPLTRYKFQLVIEPLEEGGFLATSPDVPGLLTEGDTIEEALANVPDAVETLVEAMQLKGIPLPPLSGTA
jgi:antitoxin HicB